MKNSSAEHRINIVDIIIILIVSAIVAYFAVQAVNHFMPEKYSPDSKVTVYLKIDSNLEYVDNIAIGDNLYIVGTSTALGKVSEINAYEDNAMISVLAEFPYDANVYTVDGTLVARGCHYEIRTAAFSSAAECVGIRETVSPELAKE